MRMIPLLLLMSAAFAADRWENKALLGIVSVETKDGVVIAHVLEKSPAAKAKLQKGDRLISIAGVAVKKAMHVDESLRPVEPGKQVEIVYVRDNKQATVKTKVMDRKKYKGELLKRRNRNATGHKMQPWFAYGWANVKDGEKPPTRESTKGKVLVIHTFQSW